MGSIPGRDHFSHHISFVVIYVYDNEPRLYIYVLINSIIQHIKNNIQLQNAVMIDFVILNLIMQSLNYVTFNPNLLISCIIERENVKL